MPDAAKPLPLVMVMTTLKKPALVRLAEAGFQLRTAVGPEDALDQMSRARPAALVVDLALRNHRAPAVVRTLQRKKAVPTYILFVEPTQPSAETLRQASKLGVEICPHGFDIPYIAGRLQCELHPTGAPAN